MRFRLEEGHGVCFYKIGVDDNGYPRGLSYKVLLLSLCENF